MKKRVFFLSPLSFFVTVDKSAGLHRKLMPTCPPHVLWSPLTWYGEWNGGDFSQSFFSFWENGPVLVAEKLDGGTAPLKNGASVFYVCFLAWWITGCFLSWQVCRVREKPQQTFVFVRKNPEKPLVPGGTNKTSWRSWFFLCVVLGGKIEFSTLVAD